MRIKTVTLDDEPRAHMILKNYIAQIPELEFSGSFLSASNACNFLSQNKIDLILLDITMPTVDGFAFLRMLSEPPLVIFTTAHTEFAFESFDYNAIDYLKKPIPFERFNKAIQKVKNLITGNEVMPLPEFIDFKIDGRIQSIKLDTVLYFQSFGNYIKIITIDRIYITQTTTKDIEENLPVELFIRIHKSFIINRMKIERVDGDHILIGTNKLPIGRTFKKYVTDLTTKPK